MSSSCAASVLGRSGIAESIASIGTTSVLAKYVSPGMLKAAAAMQLAGQDLDKAACGLFPFPLEL
eukprot:5386466-Pyramimonas_sp.AAC.1